MVTGTNDFSGKHSVVDYIPIVSTIVALGNLIEKYVVLPSKKMKDLSTTTDWMGRNWKHLTYTHPVRSVILMIPIIGNLIIGIYDFINIKNNDRETILKAIKEDETGLERPFKHGYYGALKFATAWLKDDKAVVLAAVETHPEALQYASPRLKNDIDVVRAAVDENGLTLQFASPDLQNNYDMVLAAVNKSGCALKYAHPRLQNEYWIVLAAVQQDGFAFHYANPLLQNEYSIVLATVSKKPYMLKQVDSSFQIDRKVVLAAVKKEGYALKFAHPFFQNDEEVVLVATSKYADALDFASQHLQRSREFLEKVVRQNPYAQRYLDKINNEYIERLLEDFNGKD